MSLRWLDASEPEENFDRNQLLDGSICLSPLDCQLLKFLEVELAPMDLDSR